MFKFKGISSNDMQVVIEEEEHFIARASQRYEITEIEGKDGAIFDELGYSIVERPIYVQCLNINKIDDILAWLNGEGEFEYKGRKTTARFYSQLEPQRSSCIRIIDTTFIRDPFWNKANEDYQLVKDRKDKQASGEYIHVEDSNNCRAKIGLSGNREQEARSGKNLLELIEGTYSNNGITAVVKNGIVTLNGTATAVSFVGINLLKSFNLTTGNTYRLSAFNTEVVGDSSNNYCSLRLNGDGTKETTFDKVNSNNAIVGNFLLSYITIRTAQGITYNNFVVKPQLELGAGTKEWEQGGIAPSLDYPSKIKTVGSNVQVFDKNNVNKLNAFINGETKVISSWENCKTLYIPCLKNKYYTVTKKGTRFIVGTTTNVPSITTNCNQISADNTAKSITIKTLDIDKYLVVFYYNSGSDTLTEQEILDSIKIVEGTEVGEYSTYGQGCVKVTKCNKNIYNKNEEIICNGVGIGANGELFSRSDQKLLIIPISKLETNIAISFTKTFSYNLRYAFSNTIVKNINSEIFNTDYIENSTTTNIKVNKIIQNNKHNYLLLGFTNKDSYSDLQVEYAKVVSSYEEHQEQSYIMPVQKEMLTDDYFDWDNEEEVHVWGNVVVNGTETINKNSNSEFFSITKSMSQFDTSAKGIKQSISNYGTGTTLALGSGNTNNKYSFNASTIYLDCYNSNINTVEKLKVQLTKNNMKIYAKLATPTRLPFTDEQKAVAKELSNARTYKNVTNITTDSKAKLSLDYFTVTDETIKNEGNIQSRPVLRLEKTVSEAVEITINNVRFKYNFNNDTYVEIDCENKTVEYEGINRNRNLFISYDFPKLNIGSNNIIMNDGDCIIKVIRKDRWL
uniref:Distal tail protein n=1 Tax=Siphoviridae sp. ct5wd11 TaxID=2827781 RepID=A0A8S5SRM9_9CAUD|nr:MAG TPA: distal tail protein [Siphoviridae sp. ct5wd11]